MTEDNPRDRREAKTREAIEAHRGRLGAALYDREHDLPRAPGIVLPKRVGPGWQPRTIQIVCYGTRSGNSAARGHTQVKAGSLVSAVLTTPAPSPVDGDDHWELWEPGGDVPVSQARIEDATGAVEDPALWVARMTEFGCPECRLTVRAGDRLGGIAGARGLHVLETFFPGHEGVKRGWAAAAHLSTLADRGVARLGLSVLGDIFQRS